MKMMEKFFQIIYALEILAYLTGGNIDLVILKMSAMMEMMKVIKKHFSSYYLVQCFQIIKGRVIYFKNEKYKDLPNLENFAVSPLPMFNTNLYKGDLLYIIRKFNKYK